MLTDTATAAVGAIMIDELEARGYQRGYAAALSTAVGPLGQMIPPSIPMVIWGVLAQQSVAKLFLAGVIPGLLVAAGFIVISIWYARRNNVAISERSNAREVVLAFRNGIWALLAPVVILGGIYGGVFTPTEASMVGALYSLIVGLFFYRELKLMEIPIILLRSMRTTAVIMFIITMAYGFAWLVARQQIPAAISHELLSLTSNHVAVILIVNVMLLILGAVMDTVSAMVILSTVLIGVGNQLGMDPIQLGAMVVINFAVGMVTPPVGYSLFIGASISGMRIEEVSKFLWPFMLVLLGVVLLVVFVPPITLWLPNLMG